MAWLPHDNNRMTTGVCDRCHRCQEGNGWTYPPQEGRREFCKEFGWSTVSGRLLCSVCLFETLPEFPGWAVIGQQIESVRVWCEHPIGTRAVVTGRTKTTGNVGELHRIVTIRPLSSPGGRHWSGNLWLLNSDHLKWRPFPRPRTAWERLLA